MAKITLGKRPKSFAPFPVKFPHPEGGEGVINVTYAYRTKSEFGKMLDDLIAEGKKAEAEKEAEVAQSAAAAPKEAAAFSWERFFAENTESSAEHLVRCIDAWDLGAPVTRETLIQLGDECPAAVAELMGKYASACREGRLGN